MKVEQLKALYANYKAKQAVQAAANFEDAKHYTDEGIAVLTALDEEAAQLPIPGLSSRPELFE